MSKFKVFISLPMSGRPDFIVKEDIEKAKEAYLAITERAPYAVEFIDTMDNPDPPERTEDNCIGVWYLGCSLKILSQCDEVFFWRNWQHASGCQIEHHVCELYHIPMICTNWEGYHG